MTAHPSASDLMRGIWVLDRYFVHRAWTARRYRCKKYGSLYALWHNAFPPSDQDQFRSGSPSAAILKFRIAYPNERLYRVKNGFSSSCISVQALTEVLEEVEE